MFKYAIGVLAGIALMRYLSDGVITDEQRNQISQNAKDLFQSGMDYAQKAVGSSSEGQ